MVRKFRKYRWFILNESMWFIFTRCEELNNECGTGKFLSIKIVHANIK